MALPTKFGPTDSRLTTTPWAVSTKTKWASYFANEIEARKYIGENGGFLFSLNRDTGEWEQSET